MERWLIKYFPIQHQDAWSTEKGLKFMHYQDPATGKLVKYSPYEMEMEAEAFGMNGSFVAEKAQKGGGPYLRKLDWIDRADAEKYLEDGVDGLRTQYHGSGYEKIDSIKGVAARQLDAANSLTQRVGYLAKKAENNPADMTDEDRQALIEGRAELNSRFKWYKETLAKSKDDERKLMGWRDDIDPDGNVHKVVKASVLEAMGTGGGE